MGMVPEVVLGMWTGIENTQVIEESSCSMLAICLFAGFIAQNPAQDAAQFRRSGRGNR
jgi:hypothetical protein